MRVYCQYSGISYNITGFGSTDLTYIHPIFAAEPKWLLSRMGHWAAQKYTEEECRLLFLALLHSTELVEFRATAVPENRTVQLNMEQLSRFVAWMTGLSRPQLVLPKFAIQPDNRKLPNIRYWLEVWQKARTDFESGYIATSELRKLRDKEVALERLIRTSTKQVEDYAGLLASWAMQAANVPKGLQDYWRSLFLLKGIKVYEARQVDLQELVEHMEEYLEHGSIFAQATMEHVRLLTKKNSAGLTYGLGLTDADLADLDSSPFTIVEGSIEQHNINVLVAAAPEEEPKAVDFASRVQYLRAHAGWKLAQRAKQYAADFTQHVETTLAEDEETNLIAEEEEEINDQPDIILDNPTNEQESDDE